MKHSITVAIALLALTVSTPTLDAAYPNWPDTTRVNWEGKTDCICYERLVWCLLESSANSDTSNSLVRIDSV